MSLNLISFIRTSFYWGLLGALKKQCVAAAAVALEKSCRAGLLAFFLSVCPDQAVENSFLLSQDRDHRPLQCPLGDSKATVTLYMSEMCAFCFIHAIINGDLNLKP
jgi:hypothetical protein